MATRLLGSAHLLSLSRSTHLLGSPRILGFTPLQSSRFQDSTHLVSVGPIRIRFQSSGNGSHSNGSWWMRNKAYVIPGIGLLISFLIHQETSTYLSKLKIRRKILKSQCSFQLPSDMAIERKELQEELKTFLDLDKYQPKPLTRIVCGPRGSGKSAAVINLLKGRKGVVHVHIRDNDDIGDLVKQVLRSLSLPVPDNTDKACLLEGALQDIQEKPKRWFVDFPTSILPEGSPDDKTPQPILVVDVNPRVESKCLDDMLLLLKSWGSDSGWIKPIVILTSMRGTLGLHRPRLELRTEFFKIDDLNEEECELYHEKLCKMIDNENTDQCKCDISKILPQNKWNRFLLLHTLAQNNISSLNELKKVVTKLEKEQTEIYENALIAFTKEMEEKKYSGQHHVFCRLMKEEKVYLKEFCDEYSLSEKEIIEILLDIKPRPFYIHPQTREVYIGSTFMMPALERMCTPENSPTTKIQTNRQGV